MDYGVPNQQVRVDIITTAADPFSVAGGDVLLNLFQTQVGDPTESGYNTVSTDVTSLFQAHQGETLRLRFAEADNQLFLASGVDNVSVNAVTASAVPETGTLALILPAVGMIGTACVTGRRKK